MLETADNVGYRPFHLKGNETIYLTLMSEHGRLQMNAETVRACLLNMDTLHASHGTNISVHVVYTVILP